jgi:biotin transport system substrate-specific component
MTIRTHIENNKYDEYRGAIALRSAWIKAGLKVGGVALFVGLTVAAARVKVPLPFTPVPMTLQPMAVLLAGAILGPWLGAISQLTYIALGLSGIPVFAGSPGAGPLVMIGPTGGYLASYPFVAFVVGKLVRRARGPVTTTLSLLVGLSIIYNFGVAHLALFLHRSFGDALGLGVAPFLVADLIKVVVASVLVTGWRSVIRSSGS